MKNLTYSILALTIIAFLSSNSHANPAPRLGIAFGTPGGLNAVLALPFTSNNGVRLSAGVFPYRDGGMLVGGQLNVFRTLFTSIKTSSDISAVAGYLEGFSSAHPNIGHWGYVGIAHGLRYGLLWTEIGLTMGQSDRGDFTNPQLILQLGVTFPLRR